MPFLSRSFLIIYINILIKIVLYKTLDFFNFKLKMHANFDRSCACVKEDTFSTNFTNSSAVYNLLTKFSLFFINIAGHLRF